MKKIKHWLITRVLPVWAKESLLRENEHLTEENRELKARINQLLSYIDGLEAGMKSQRRVVINNNLSEVRRIECKHDEQVAE